MTTSKDVTTACRTRVSSEPTTHAVVHPLKFPSIRKNVRRVGRRSWACPLMSPPFPRQSPHLPSVPFDFPIEMACSPLLSPPKFHELPLLPPAWSLLAPYGTVKGPPKLEGGGGRRRPRATSEVILPQLAHAQDDGEARRQFLTAGEAPKGDPSGRLCLRVLVPW